MNTSDSHLPRAGEIHPESTPITPLAEQRLAALLAAMPKVTPDLLAVVELPNYQLEYLNPAGITVLGLKAGVDLREHSLMEFVPSQCLFTLLNEAAPAAWRQGYWKGEMELRRNDGVDFPCSVVLVAQPAGGGFADWLCLMARDLSGKNAAIENLKQDQRFLRALLESVPDAIYFKDRESKFLRISASLAKRFALESAEAAVGKSDADFFAKEHAQAAYEMEQEIMGREKPVLNAEEKEAWPDGRVTWVSSSKLPLHNEFGQVIGTYGLSRDITARKHTEAALATTQRNLLEASRLAGKAEVASGVLHNVGNALNSVNTSTALVLDQLTRSHVTTLPKLVAMLQEHRDDLGAFITADPKGRQLPGFIAQLSEELLREREDLHRELESLRKGVEHIKSVIAMQQNYVHASYLTTDLDFPELVDQALLISEASLARHQITVVRAIDQVPRVHGSHHKILEILVNLITNAKHAIDAADKKDKKITIRLASTDPKWVQVSVKDNGVGIAQENLDRIFSFGFTTKKDGHGFGLHSSALAAQEMGGTLVARSGGPGTGAEFVLELPTANP